MKKYINQGSKDTRSGFGEGLTELGRINKEVVALCADLTGSLKMEVFAKENPNRFFSDWNCRSKYDRNSSWFSDWR